jgi:lipoprotein-releasing system permease protein
MGYPLWLALRYLRSKKRAFVSVGTTFAVLGVTLGVAALAIVMSVTGGFQHQFREKVLGVNAHVLVLKYSTDFRDYHEVMDKVGHVEVSYPCIPAPRAVWPVLLHVCEEKTRVTGVAPFVISPMMLTHGERTATGVLVKGVDPELMPQVLDLPKHVLPGGSLEGLRRPGAKPPEKPPREVSAPPKHSSLGKDAGAGPSILEIIASEIAEDEAKNPHDAGAAMDPSATGIWDVLDAGTTEVAPALADAPLGDVTPDGGYASTLPESDELPEFIDPDPCKSAEAVARMPGIVVGRALAKQLGVTIGDCVQVTSPTIGLSFGASMRPPVAKRFRVIAMFEAGFDQYDSKLAYTDIYEAQAFYDQGDSVTGVEMKVDDIDHARDVAAAIDAILANSVYHTMDWMDLNYGLFTALLIQQIGMSVVLALIIVVAAFTVIATLIMVVLDKKREIALLKALGAKDGAILRVFLYQGAIIGVLGTTLGLVLGWLCCKFLIAYAFPLDPKVYFISTLPVNLRWQEFAITGVFSILTCLVATIFPSLYAAGLRPADGLRAE